MSQLQNTKKGSLSIDEYLLKMKNLVDGLRAAGNPITYDQLILYVLTSLGPEYEAMVVNLTSRENLTLQEVQFLLQNHEIRIESHVAALSLYLNGSSTNMAQFKKPPFPNSNQQNQNMNQGNRGSGTNLNNRDRGSSRDIDGIQVVQNKWLFRTKLNSDGSVERLKARLVAKWFQKIEGVDYFDTFSLVVKPSTLRIMFTLVVTNNWDIQVVDVNNAFLNGELKEYVYMQQPKGFEDCEHHTHVCKLQKTKYGLKQASMACYEKLKSALLSWGYVNFVYDFYLFISNNKGHPLLVLVYVNDILITGHDPAAIQ
uniref:Reverse transcriptase Ty1/copia-type domain-containing protein n=1 Tax=Cannabis sativa TaxID=3483 RepID=A0A803PB16_CANSA